MLPKRGRACGLGTIVIVACMLVVVVVVVDIGAAKT